MKNGSKILYKNSRKVFGTLLAHSKKQLLVRVSAGVCIILPMDANTTSTFVVQVGAV